MLLPGGSEWGCWVELCYYRGIFVGCMWTEGLCCYLRNVCVGFRDVGQRGQLMLEGCECEYKGYRGSVLPLQGSG